METELIGYVLGRRTGLGRAHRLDGDRGRQADAARRHRRVLGGLDAWGAASPLNRAGGADPDGRTIARERRLLRRPRDPARTAPRRRRERPRARRGVVRALGARLRPTSRAASAPASSAPTSASRACAPSSTSISAGSGVASTLPVDLRQVSRLPTPGLDGRAPHPARTRAVVRRDRASHRPAGREPRGRSSRSGGIPCRS